MRPPLHPNLPSAVTALRPGTCVRKTYYTGASRVHRTLNLINAIDRGMSSTGPWGGLRMAAKDLRQSAGPQCRRSVLKVRKNLKSRGTSVTVARSRCRRPVCGASLGVKSAFAAGGVPPAYGSYGPLGSFCRRLLGQRRTCPARVAVLEAKSGKRHDREQHDPMLYQKLRHRYSFSLVIGHVSIYYRVSSLCDR
jgi:hypothetical protein